MSTPGFTVRRKNGNEYFVNVDASDLERVLAAGAWRVQPAKHTVYVIRGIYLREGKETAQGLHRFITGAPEGFDVDHINQNGLDNRRENLRVCTRSQNLMNRRGRRAGLKGASRHYGGKWQAMITINRQRVYLGTYETEQQAHQAYCAAAERIHGEYARFEGMFR